MICAWKELLSILPQRLRGQLTAWQTNLLELRLRLNRPVELVLPSESKWLPETVTQEDLSFSLNAASH